MGYYYFLNMLRGMFFIVVGFNVIVYEEMMFLFEFVWFVYKCFFLLYDEFFDVEILIIDFICL